MSGLGLLIDCPQCLAPRGQPCRTLFGFLKLPRPHRSRDRVALLLPAKLSGFVPHHGPNAPKARFRDSLFDAVRTLNSECGSPLSDTDLAHLIAAPMRSLERSIIGKTAKPPTPR